MLSPTNEIVSPSRNAFGSIFAEAESAASAAKITIANFMAVIFGLNGGQVNKIMLQM